MAKWGEGDPRWIVEMRPDAHNVNNWHWSEKDATAWSKKEIKKLLVGTVARDDNIGSCFVSEIKSCDGEATINNRKKKIICFYEFQVKAAWKGSLTGSQIVYEGELFIPNLSEEQEPDDLDVSVSFAKDHPKCEKLKELMRTKGAALIREQLGKYAENLKKDCACTLQVPTSTSAAVPAASAVSNTPMTNNSVASNFKQQQTPKPVTVKNDSVGMKIPTKKLVMTVKFMTEVSELWKTLVKHGRISAWSRSPVHKDAAAKEDFVFFGGNVIGTYTQLQENSKMVMRWRLKSWPDAHYSVATITFNQTSDGAELKLEQTGVPENSIEATKSGWHKYYWNPIKSTFGFGTDMMGVF